MRKERKGRERRRKDRIYAGDLSANWTLVAAVDQYMAMIAGHARK
jgi:hypothetical protein